MATMNQNQYGYYNNQQQSPVQYPYNNNLINNGPYDNYMGRVNQSQFQNLQNQYLKCRPVSSREEAMAFQIDLDGSLWVFPSISNGKIYTKQINNDGSATFSTYTLSENENPYNSNEYVTKTEFNKAIQNIMATIHPNNSGQQEQSNDIKDNNLSF